MHLEAGGFQDIFQNAKRAGVGRGHRWAAKEIAGNGEGVGHHAAVVAAPTISLKKDRFMTGIHRPDKVPRQSPAAKAVYLSTR
jgi:hypothetical protein